MSDAAGGIGSGLKEVTFAFISLALIGVLLTKSGSVVSIIQSMTNSVATLIQRATMT